MRDFSWAGVRPKFPQIDCRTTPTVNTPSLATIVGPPKNPKKKKKQDSAGSRPKNHCGNAGLKRVSKYRLVLIHPPGRGTSLPSAASTQPRASCPFPFEKPCNQLADPPPAGEGGCGQIGWPGRLSQKMQARTLISMRVGPHKMQPLSQRDVWEIFLYPLASVAGFFALLGMCKTANK